MSYRHHNPKLIPSPRWDSKLSGDLDTHFLVWSHKYARTTTHPVEPTSWINIQSHTVFGWSTWHPLKYKRCIYIGTHYVLTLHSVESKMNWRWELILHKLPYIWHDSVHGLSNACNFQETKGGMRKKNGELGYNKVRKEKRNKHEGWRVEGKNNGKKRGEKTEIEWMNSWMNERRKLGGKGRR